MATICPLAPNRRPLRGFLMRAIARVTFLMIWKGAHGRGLLNAKLKLKLHSRLHEEYIRRRLEESENASSEAQPNEDLRDSESPEPELKLVALWAF